jgi:hypothetical protein
MDLQKNIRIIVTKSRASVTQLFTMPDRAAVVILAAQCSLVRTSTHLYAGEDVLDLAVMRVTLLTSIAIVSLISGCHILPNGSSMNHAEAQKLSDSFMSDLVADRVDLALDKMEPQFLQEAGGKTKAESGLRDLFNYCGRPLESELRHEDTGFFIYGDGRRAPTRGFYYSGRTTQHPKGVCFFAVRVVPGENGMKVVSVGPLKLLTGQLPDWAR